MPFTAPAWVPRLREIPDSISLDRFMLDERYGRAPLRSSRPPFICGLSGKSYSAEELSQRVDHLARALCKQLGFRPDEGSEWDKVVAVFSLNTIDYITLAWAVHRIGGILTCVNAAYNSTELGFQMKDSGAKAIFTCLPLLKTCKDGVKEAQIPDEKIFLMPLPEALTPKGSAPPHQTINDLIAIGSKLPAIQAADANWRKGDNAKKIAFLCYSSGTSGLPKGVTISHQNCIANVLQISTFEDPNRLAHAKRANSDNYTECSLGTHPNRRILENKKQKLTPFHRPPSLLTHLRLDRPDPRGSLPRRQRRRAAAVRLHSDAGVDPELQDQHTVPCPTDDHPHDKPARRVEAVRPVERTGSLHRGGAAGQEHGGEARRDVPKLGHPARCKSASFGCLSSCLGPASDN